MTMPQSDAKEERLRRYLAEDPGWTLFDDLEAVPTGRIFIQHPDGGYAVWRKPPLWALRQPPVDPIRFRTRGGLYKP